MSKIIYPADGSFPFSAAIRVGDFVFVSVQLSFTADGTLSNGPIKLQTRLVLDSLKRILETAGCTLDDVVRCACTLQDPRDFGGFNSVYAKYFPKDPPTRSTVIATLVLDARIEIECTAYKIQAQ